MSAVMLRLSRLGAGRAVVLGFFAALLAVGLGVYRDYGISWDEMDTRAQVGLGHDLLRWRQRFGEQSV